MTNAAPNAEQLASLQLASPQLAAPQLGTAVANGPSAALPA